MTSPRRTGNGAVMERLRSELARLVVPAQLLFVTGFLLAGLVQPRPYSARDDDISDLGALTAHHPWVELAPSLVAGAATIAFAVLVLGPLVGGLGPWLLALSLMGLDNVSDAFFRLDCGRDVRGCTESLRTASWHAQLHEVIGLVSALATVAAFALLARRFRELPGWQDLAAPAHLFAAAFAAGLLAYAALAEHAGGGLAQRLLVLMLLTAFGVLAARSHRSLTTDRLYAIAAKEDDPPTDPRGAHDHHPDR